MRKDLKKSFPTKRVKDVDYILKHCLEGIDYSVPVQGTNTIV